MVENRISIRGRYRDILIGPGKRIVYDSGWRSNTIVRQCRVLLAGFMKSDQQASGIQYLAVGQGDEAWDAQWNTATPPPPDPSSTNLQNRFDPPIPVPPASPVPGKDYLEIIYLDDSDNPAASGVVTNTLQIKAVLSPGYPAPSQFNTYPLREFGLFGSFGATDYMINYVKHPVIYKDTSATLVREIRLYF
jgi:hypothetical protein